MTTPPTEAEVRALRDAIYGPSTDKCWDACKIYWLSPGETQWLIEHQPNKH